MRLAQPRSASAGVRGGGASPSALRPSSVANRDWMASMWGLRECCLPERAYRPGTGRRASHYSPNAVTTLTRPRGRVARCAGAGRPLRRRAMAKRRSGAILTRLHLDRESAVPVWRQLEQQLRQADPRPAAARRRPPAVEPGRSPRTSACRDRRSSRCSSASRRRASSRCATARAPSWPRRCPSRSRRPRRPTARRAIRAPPRSSELGARLLSLQADIEVHDNRAFLPNTPAYDHFPFAIWQNCVSRQTRRAYRDNMGYAEPGRASSRCAGRSPAISRCTAVTPATRSRSSSPPARMRPS